MPRFTYLVSMGVALCLALCASPYSVLIAADRPEISSVTIGVGGSYKVGFWTPVWITVTGGDRPLQGTLTVETPDPDGTPVRFALPVGDASIGPHETIEVLRYIRFGRLDVGLTVVLAGDGQEVRRRFPASPLPPDGELLVTLGRDIGVAASFGSDLDASRTAVVEINDAARLPDAWYGYQAVDVLVVTTFDNPAFEAMTDSQFAALRQWVRLGGRLMLCVGAAGERVVGPAVVETAVGDLPTSQARLAEFVPGEFVDVVSVTNAAALENFGRSAQRLDLGAAGRLEMTVLASPRGRVDLLEVAVGGEQPMVIRAPFGFGQVQFVAFDLDQPPLAEWPGRGRFVAQLLAGETAAQPARPRRPQTGRVAHVGYRDLVGQLRSALDQFPGISFVAFSWVAGIILVYILLIGPVDYFFLKNVLGRMQFTWVTFPLIAVAFAGTAVALNQQLKGDRLLVNQIDVVDLDASDGLVRGSMWAHLYSPRTAAYDMRLRTGLIGPNGPQAPQSLLAWQGLPGDGLGGMESAAAASAFDRPYTVTRQAGLGTVVDLPVQVAATAALHGNWWAETELAVATQLERTPDGLLEGEIVNPLPVELHDCLVLYSVWAYRLERTGGTLRPGQRTRVEVERPLNLEWRLTRRRVLDNRNVTTPWNAQSLDVPRLIEVMMFHGAAGGDDYTSLTHRYQNYLDLSDHLQSGRAILLGRASEPGRTLEIDGADDPPGDRWTFCRVLFPVSRTPARATDNEARTTENRQRTTDNRR